LGSVIAFLGITIIFWNDFSFDFSLYSIGIIAILISSGIQGFVSVIIKKHGNHLHPLSINFLPLLLSGIILIPFGYFFEDQTNFVIDSKGIYSILYLAVLSNVISFTVYYWLMKKISVVILSLSSFITPVIALILGVIILNEKITIYHIVGSSLVLIGIIFANFKGLIKYYKEKREYKFD
jgi:drug/metabolite transporter (DMT)-like permease